ncbi:MAG TPA: hypothetical protein VJA21_27290, partial [Verrucomicrobiae bacterium]
MTTPRIGLALIALSLHSATAGLAGQKTLAGWEFTRPDDLQGWQPNGHLAGVVVTNGALCCRAVGSDPILEYQPLLDLPATPWQAVEIRLRADSDGTAELFWSGASTGRYGGFSQEKTTRFNVRGDNQWHTYRLLPFWHKEGRIVRLRFDVYDGARFGLGAIRVVDVASSPATERTDFDFGQSLEGWQWWTPLDEGAIPLGAAPGRIAGCGTGFLLGPPMRVNSANNTFVSIRMSADRGHYGTL